MDRFRVRITGLRVVWWTKVRQVGQPEVHRLNQDRGLGLGVVKPLTHIASPKEYVFFFFFFFLLTDFLVVLKMKANNWVFYFISLILLTTTVHCFTKNNKEYRICFWFWFLSYKWIVWKYINFCFGFVFFYVILSNKTETHWVLFCYSYLKLWVGFCDGGSYGGRELQREWKPCRNWFPMPIR